jgi:hypothetical protein
MRGCLLGGLGLFLGCLVSQAQGQEVHWRPASQPDVAAVSLGRPTSAPASESAVQPAAFTPDSDWAPRLVIRAAGSEVQKPLPQGPAIEGGPEPLPQPKPIQPAPKSTTVTDDWGGALPPLGVFNPDGAVGVVPFPEDCGPDCCGNCCETCPGCDCFGSCCCGQCLLPHFWASAEYLMWTVRGANLPPLVTHNTLSAAEEKALLTGAPGEFTPGGIGQPGTQTLFGGNTLGLGLFSGGRFTMGLAGPNQELGFEASFFFLGPQDQNFFAASSGAAGSPSLFRPFINRTPGVTTAPFPTTTAGFVNLKPLQNAETVAIAPFIMGNVGVNYHTSLWGAEANFRHPLWCSCDGHLDLLVGFRYLDLSESLTITESLTFLPAIGTVPPNGPGLVGGNDLVVDGFSTHNHFYGGQIGFDYEHRCGRWIFGVTPKVALGSMEEIVNIAGYTTVTAPGGGSVTGPGGLLAAGSNMGRHTSDRFAVMPEVGLKLGYQLTDHLKAYVGYDFLYVSSVVRPGDQVDLNVNLRQKTILGGNGLTPSSNTPAVPAVLFRRTDFWAQGGNVGLEFTW